MGWPKLRRKYAQPQWIPQPAEYPHCNSEVLHAPGTCQYCDMYPDRQQMRIASNTPFTPKEANGWYGNVAVPNA